MKVLVTGGAGFIGSHVCDALLNKGHSVICIDNFNDYYSPKTKEDNINHNLNNPDFKLYKEDICNIEGLKKVFEAEAPEKIIHLAARAGVRPSIKQPLLYEQVNVRGTLNLLELAKEFKIKQFISASSSSVYGKNKKAPFSESDPVDAPISPYAATKKAGELLCHTYHHLYGIPITCLRFFTVYGPRGRPDMAPYIFTKLINGGKPIQRFGDGSSRRDYTYVADIVAGVMAALENELGYEIINLGNSETVALSQLISVIEKHLGKKAEIIEKPMPPGDVPVTYADISKAKRLLGYNPKTSTDKGMENFIEWYLKQIEQ